MLIASRPGTYPVAGFPAGSITAAKSSRTRNVAVETSGRFVLECTTFEAAGTTGEIVGTAVSRSAVPITRSDVGAGGESKGGATPATTVATEVITRPEFPAALAGVPPLEV